jgi:NADPH-dependent ferric siderophore reductase
MLTLTVRGRERVSPHFMSVTLGGDDFRHLERSGYDQAGRLFFPGPGQDGFVIPSSEKWMRHYALQPAAKRPRVRLYSIRRFRPELSEIDIEIVIHEENPGGPAAAGAAWALTAEPGDQVGFLDEGYAYVPTPDATWQLLVGDESALPAILAILERSADALPAEVFLEVPADGDIRPEVTASARVHWLPRNDPAMRPGTLALQAVKDARLRPGPCYVWTAGESSLPTGLRRHLVNERGVPKSDIAFLGYWKHGRASLG